jgi:hypothetical protein
MAIEQEYRDLLRKAQNCAECVEYFLAAIRKSPRSRDAELAALIASAEVHAKTLESELDRIWDLFKRTSELRSDTGEPAA